MKLNHLNLTVANVTETSDFLHKYFGLHRASGGPSSDGFALVFDDDNLVLTLMKGSQNEEIKYPSSFHIGFVQESEEKVNEIYQRLQQDGFEVKPPRHFHGSWTFYLRSPGGFLIEVLA